MKHIKCMCRELEEDKHLKYDINSQNYISDDRYLKAFENATLIEQTYKGSKEDFYIDYADVHSEQWETLFFPQPDYNCGETIDIYDNACYSTEHWSNREEGQHDVITTLCHFCVIHRKKNMPYIVEYSKVKWDIGVNQ